MSARRKVIRSFPTDAQPVIVSYQSADGTWCVIKPNDEDIPALEDGLPARKVPKYRNQPNTPGLYYSATDDRHLQFESHLEMRWMRIFDFDPTVTAMVAQPLHIRAIDDDQNWGHFPDLFLKRADGTCEVIDVKNPNKLNDPDVLKQAIRTEAVCDEYGWGYRLLGETDQTLDLNIGWLAGYRRNFPCPDDIVEDLLARAATPLTIRELSDNGPTPELARAVMFRLMWLGKLQVNLTAPLRDSSTVWATETTTENPIA